MLAPIALLFALPLLWMLLSSFMTNAQINRFPPTIIPDSLHLDGYRYVFENADVPALVPELDDRRRGRRWSSNLVFCSLAGYAFARHALPRLDGCCSC